MLYRKSFFGAVDAKRRHVPRNNVICSSARLALAGAFLLPALAGATTGYDLGANLLNFGALIAFMGVNAGSLCALLTCTSRRKEACVICFRLFSGFVICSAALA